MAKASVHETVVTLAGRAVPVRFHRNARARQIILRVDCLEDGFEGIVLTLPRRTAHAEGLDLARHKSDWVLERLAGMTPRVPFADGALVPVGGVEHRIRHLPAAGLGVWRQDFDILVAGRAEHLARRVRDWFRAEAKDEITRLVRDKARLIERPAGRVTIRDTRSRWGSCSHDGNLSFCWRLMMAPAGVLDYVVAHEVAHLRWNNHGPRFWGAVAGLTPDPDGARAWLNDFGERLHRYG